MSHLGTLWQLPGNLYLPWRTSLSSRVSCERILSATRSQLGCLLPHLYWRVCKTHGIQLQKGAPYHTDCWAIPLRKPVVHLQFSLVFRATVICWVCVAKRMAQPPPMHSHIQWAIPKDSQRILMKTRKLSATKSNCSPGPTAPPLCGLESLSQFHPKEPKSREENPFCIQQHHPRQPLSRVV